MENKTGFVASAFDVMHLGYILMLKECKDNCNYLIAALQVNPSWERQDKNSPIMSLHERFLVLKSIRYVDEIAVYKKESDLKNLLKFYKPDVRFLGSDYKEVKLLKITGYTLCTNIHYIERFHDYSSSDLRKRIYKAEKEKEDLENFKQNEGRVYE